MQYLDKRLGCRSGSYGTSSSSRRRLYCRDRVPCCDSRRSIRGSSAVVSGARPESGSGSTELTVDCVTRRTTEAICGEDLVESRLVSQAFHPLLVLRVRQRVGVCVKLVPVATAGRTENGSVLLLLVPLNRLCSALRGPRATGSLEGFSFSVRVMAVGRKTWSSYARAMMWEMAQN